MVLSIAPLWERQRVLLATGVPVNIGKVIKDGRPFFRFLYRQHGKRKQAWRATFKDAKTAADDAIEATFTRDASALKPNANDRRGHRGSSIVRRDLNTLTPSPA